MNLKRNKIEEIQRQQKALKKGLLGETIVISQDVSPIGDFSVSTESYVRFIEPTKSLKNQKISALKSNAKTNKIPPSKKLNKIEWFY